MTKPVEPNLLTPPSIGNAPSSPFSWPKSLFVSRVKGIFDCNPFYILSAAFLLYGVYRISVEPNFLSHEIGHLIFNYTSLQCYELLLVLTAVFLARRHIWYDSMLLAGLENLLIFVPFILVSQAALISKPMVWTMCVTAGILALLRFAGLKAFVPHANLRPRLLKIGFLILAFNVALPIVYRSLHESKFGTKLEWGPAFWTNEYAWLIAVPMICSLAQFVPSMPFTNRGRSGRAWVPLGWFALWLGGTCVHLYCLGYVYDFSLRADLLAPGAWVLCWTAYRRVPAYVSPISLFWQRALMVLPVIVPLLAASQSSNKVFLTLCVINATIYNRIYAKHRGPRLALHLVLISLASVVAELPQAIGPTVVTQYERPALFGLAVAGYVLACGAISRNPKMGILTALVAGVVTASTMQLRSDFLHCSLQVSFVALLLHSMRWVDALHPGAPLVRMTTAVLAAGHAWFWMSSGGDLWIPCCVAAAVCCFYLAVSFMQGHWGRRILLGYAGFVGLYAPFDFVFSKLRHTPVGLLAIIGSFALFALGTLAALKRARGMKDGAS